MFAILWVFDECRRDLFAYIQQIRLEMLKMSRSMQHLNTLRYLTQILDHVFPFSLLQVEIRQISWGLPEMEFNRAYYLLPDGFRFKNLKGPQKPLCLLICCWSWCPELKGLKSIERLQLSRLWNSQDARLLQWRGVADAATCLGWCIVIPPKETERNICGSSFFCSLVSWLRWICGNSAKWKHEESSWMHHGHLTSSLSWQFAKQQKCTVMFKDNWRIRFCFVIARLAEACCWTDIVLTYLMSLVSWPCTVCKLHSHQQSNQQK